MTEINTIAAEAQHRALGLTGEVDRGTDAPWQRTTHPDAQWFPAAGLGLFIHMGLSSVSGRCDLSWGMVADTPWDAQAENRNKLAPNDYFALADHFNPDAWDPLEMLREAKAAGCRYAVLTTKHHEGFTLWPSQFGDFGVQTHLDGRDLIAPFIAACRALDLKIGLYYSPPDWWFDRHHRDWRWQDPPERGGVARESYGMDHRPAHVAAKPADHDARRIELVRGQVRELLTRWGRIDLFWFDGGEGEISSDEVRAMQPHIVINKRNAGRGDFDHTECQLPRTPFPDWSETCHVCWPHWGWGWFENAPGDSAAQVLEKLVQVRTWGGNFLANVGPDAHGRPPGHALECWRDLAEWMKTHAEAIHDVARGPFPGQSSVPVTVSVSSSTVVSGAVISDAVVFGNRATWYLLPPPGHRDAITLTGVKQPSEVVLLRTGEHIPVEWTAGTARIVIPAHLRTDLVDGVRVRFA